MLSEISQSGSLCRFVTSYEPVNATIFWVEVEKSQHEQPAVMEAVHGTDGQVWSGNPQVRLDRVRP